MGASDIEKGNNGIVHSAGLQKYCKFKQRSGLLDVSDVADTSEAGPEVKIKDI